MEEGGSMVGLADAKCSKVFQW